MSAVQWESLMSNVDPLLKEGYHITISRVNVPSEVYEDAWRYRVDVTDDDGTIIATGESYPLTEAMAEAWVSTPEKAAEEAASDG